MTHVIETDYVIVDAYGGGADLIYINTVYDTDEASWVTWPSTTGFDTTGASYPYTVGNWKANTYAEVKALVVIPE